MGFELLTQPQVFLTKLTAVGGIEGYVPPFIAQFYTWTIIANEAGNIFDIPYNCNSPVGLTHAPDSAFIVNISGSIIAPPDFDIDFNFRRLILSNPVPKDTRINLTQIGTIALSTANYSGLTGLNFNSVNSYIENVNSQNIITDQLTTNNLVVSANNARDAVYISQAGTGNALFIESDPSIFGATPFVVTSAGDVGIGTTIPGSKLTVDGVIQGGEKLFLDKDSFNESWIGARGPLDETSRTAIGFSVFTDTDPLSGTIEDIVLRTNGKNRLLIDSAGHVGIGTQAPLNTLHIETSGNGRVLQTTTDNTSPTIQQNFSTAYIDSTAKLEVLDPVNGNFFNNAGSHAIEFRRDVPSRPVNFWLTKSPVETTTFDLSGGPILQAESQAYIVTIGGVIQPYTAYTIDSINRQITFNTNVPVNTDVYVLQTLNPVFSTAYDSVVTQAVSSTPNAESVFPLSGLANPLTVTLGQYVVGVEGVYQIPNNPPYTITPEASTITFVSDVPSNLLVTVTRIPSAISFAGEAIEACFLGTFYTWTTSVSTSISQFNLIDGPTKLLSDRNSYLVNIGGVLQTPNSYRINPVARQLQFNGPVNGSIENPVDIAVTQLAAPEMPIKYSTVIGLGDRCYSQAFEPINEIVTVEQDGLTVLGTIKGDSLSLEDNTTSTNTVMGTAVLPAASGVTINTNKVTLNSRIFLTTLVPQPGFSSIGSLFVGDRVNTTSFTVSSTNVNDRSIFSWMIVEPA
jgi:hypothetical protein